MIVFLPGCDVIDFEMNLVFLHGQNVKVKIQISWDQNKWYIWKRIFKLDIFKIVEVSKTDFSRRFNRRKRRSYSEPIQGSMMVRFVKTFSWNSLTTFAKSSMLDVWLRSKCASDFSSNRSSFKLYFIIKSRTRFRVNSFLELGAISEV